MNYLLKIGVRYVLFFLIMPIVFSKNTSVSDCLVTPYQVIMVSPIRDANDNCVIQVEGGPVGSDPSTWTTTIISDSVSATNNFAPCMISNTVGDVVIVWMYIDSFGVCQVAASVLLHAKTTWYSATLSNSNGDALFKDHRGSINENGNALVVWTANHHDTNLNSFQGATAMLSTSTVWSAPFVIFN